MDDARDAKEDDAREIVCVDLLFVEEPPQEAQRRHRESEATWNPWDVDVQDQADSEAGPYRSQRPHLEREEDEDGKQDGRLHAEDRQSRRQGSLREKRQQHPTDAAQEFKRGRAHGLLSALEESPASAAVSWSSSGNPPPT